MKRYIVNFSAKIYAFGFVYADNEEEAEEKAKSFDNITDFEIYDPCQHNDYYNWEVEYAELEED